MLAVFVGFADDPSVAGTITAVGDMIRQRISIDTGSDRSMCLCIAYRCRYPLIKSIEISESIAIVVGIDVFDYTAIETVDIVQSLLV